MLRVTGLKKSFGIDELFHDVSFEVARGDKVGFVGANGAGKTTLMRCLLGQEENDGGTIQLDEAATIGYVEQQADFGTGTLYEEEDCRRPRRGGDARLQQGRRAL